MVRPSKPSKFPPSGPIVEGQPPPKRLKNKEKYAPKGNKERKKREREAEEAKRRELKRAEVEGNRERLGKGAGGEEEKEEKEEKEDEKVTSSAPSKDVEAQKKARKEEKRKAKEARKAARAAAKAENVAGSGSGSGVVQAVAQNEAADASPAQPAPAPSEPVAQPAVAEAVEGKEKKEKKDKKDKKKKKRSQPDADANAVAEPAVAAAASADTTAAAEEPKKKRKKHSSSTTALPAPAPSGSTTLAPSPSPSSTSTPTPAPAATSSSVATSSPGEISAYLKTNHITLSSLTPHPILSFSQLPVHPLIASQLKKFSQPTPIQACAWPALLEGRDVVGIAETGSGKTLAFGVPGLQRLVASYSDDGKLPPSAGASAEDGGKKGKKNRENKEGKAGGKGKGKPKIEMLVIAPTRELAIQTHDTLLSLSTPFGLSSVCLYGGVPKSSQLSALAQPGAKILVGTPGRILDLARDGLLELGGVGYLVLDEADRMLDRGFEPDIRAIVGMVRQEGRQTAMFSATWPESVRRLAASFQTNPFRITVGADDLSANKRVSQSVEVLSSSYDKDARLRSLLQSLKHRTHSKGESTEEERTLVFVLYKKEATRVEQSLARMGYKVAAIHGDMGQQARIAALEEFKQGKVKLLVATDVAARGLDIPNVGTVVNYSFPLTVEDYIHRIGRTGRGGASGRSVTFFTGEAHEKALAGELMRVLRDAGAEVPPEMSRFPSTIRKKEHAVYGAFFKEGVDMDAKPKKITFD